MAIAGADANKTRSGSWRDVENLFVAAVQARAVPQLKH